MNDEHVPLIEPLRSPWRKRLLAALASVQRDLLLVGPYIKDDVIAMVGDTLEARPDSQPLSVRVITRILPDDFLAGASDIAALQRLLSWSISLPGSRVELRAIANVHAKVWVFDSDLALIGSGNATTSGLDANLEYGLAVADPGLVARILEDWQEWWEQAEPVSVQMLTDLERWLTVFAGDTEVHAAEKLAREQRQAAERRIGTAPRIGKRLIMTPNERHVAFENIHVPYVAAQVQEASPPVHSQAIRASALPLWQALAWTAPLFDEEESPRIAHGDFLKITVRSAAAGQYMLRCSWADGRRSSQATIPISVPEPSVSWTITLDRMAAEHLAEFVRNQAGVPVQNQSQAELLIWLQSSPSRLCVTQANAESSVPLAIPCLPASMSATFPVLRPPLSQITIAHDQLVTGLMVLAQNWQMGELNTSLPETIALSFGSSEAVSAVRLALGPIDAPVELSIPGTDNILNGPAITLQLGLASFRHILTSAQDCVRRWRLYVDRDAAAVQFAPEFGHDLTWADVLAWRHELRDVAGG